MLFAMVLNLGKAIGLLLIISLYIIFLITNEMSFYNPLTNTIIQHEAITINVLRHSMEDCRRKICRCGAYSTKQVAGSRYWI